MQVGKTKVFLRAGQMAELDARRTLVLSAAAKKIQRRIRTHQAQKRFILLRKATISLQALCRGEPSDSSHTLLIPILRTISWLEFRNKKISHSS